MNLMISLAKWYAGRRLAGEEERARRHLELRVLAQAVVEHDDVQRVQELPLVFVDALDLAVEDACRDRPPVPGVDSSQSANRDFGLALGRAKRGAERLVVRPAA